MPIFFYKNIGNVEGMHKEQNRGLLAEGQRITTVTEESPAREKRTEKGGSRVQIILRRCYQFSNYHVALVFRPSYLIT